MGRRVKPTHRMTVHRPPPGSDSYTEDPTDTTDELLVQDKAVRFWATGGLVRTEGGEMVMMGPNITANGDLSEVVREGDIVSLEPINEGHRPFDGMEITSIREIYGRGSKPIKTRLRVDEV